jgi:hypothetical protein
LCSSEIVARQGPFLGVNRPWLGAGGARAGHQTAAPGEIRYAGHFPQPGRRVYQLPYVTLSLSVSSTSDCLYRTKRVS